VGGDYYDFRVGADGALSAAIGDATGHGARAATMVTILKSLFAAAEAAGEDPAAFLAQASTAVRRMELERMTMAFALAQFRGTATGATMTLASAAMPPALVFRVRSGSVEEIAMQGLPLGTMSMQYEQRSVTLQRGDVVLLMTDGLAELIGTNGEPFGYTAVETTFASVGTLAPQEMVDRLAAAAADWTGGQPPGDDITFVAIRIT
jgi:serine phosphatase RsbU (regulator of sigma subunit)